nr:MULTISPECIES: SMI1/KNR4 family protein [unclassified Streptomyces]
MDHRTGRRAEPLLPLGQLLRSQLYMPFDALLFFGDNGGGDQFAFVQTPRRPDVFVWEHETDSRRWVAGDLRDYLGRSLAAGGDDWYR